jgi:hypothetical protein
MRLAEWEVRQARIDDDLAALDRLVGHAYSWRGILFHPWRTFRQRRAVDAELDRLQDELGDLLAADIEFPTI